MSRQAVPGQMFVWRYAELERRAGALFGDLAGPLDFPKPNLCDICGEARLLSGAAGSSDISFCGTPEARRHSCHRSPSTWTMARQRSQRSTRGSATGRFR